MTRPLHFEGLGSIEPGARAVLVGRPLVLVRNVLTPALLEECVDILTENDEDYTAIVDEYDSEVSESLRDGPLSRVFREHERLSELADVPIGAGSHVVNRKGSIGPHYDMDNGLITVPGLVFSVGMIGDALFMARRHRSLATMLNFSVTDGSIRPLSTVKSWCSVYQRPGDVVIFANLPDMPTAHAVACEEDRVTALIATI